MRDSSFENIWREVLKDASKQPPQEVWEGIERQLSQDDPVARVFASTLRNASAPPPVRTWEAIENELNTSIEKDIAGVFETASIPAPSTVWNKVEKELDKDRKPFVFWFTRGVTLAAAASILWFLAFNIQLAKDLDTTNVLAANEAAGSTQEVQQSDRKILDPSVVQQLSVDQSNENLNIVPAVVKVAENENFESTLLEAISSYASDKQVVEESKPTRLVEQLQDKWSQNIAKISGQAFTPYGSSLTLNRPKLPSPFESQEDEGKSKKRAWLGFMSGIAPFDPNIQITNFESQALVTAQNVPAGFFAYNSVVQPPNAASSSDVFEIPLSQPFNAIRPGNAINLGLNYGFKLHRNVSVHVGARYNRGVSFIESNVYNYNRITGDVSTFLETHYILQESGGFNNTLISFTQDTKNAYQFLMVPVQLGFEMPIFKKLEAGVNVGLSGDFLVNNVLNDVREGGSNLTPSNSAYKQMNVSGLGGLHLNYRVNDSWQASVGANLQQTFNNGVAQSQNFSFRPRYVGVNYGINYTLK